MGQEGHTIVERMISQSDPPKSDEIELGFFGPGYGECILVHIGDHKWVIVDSCLDTESHATALSYLRELGSDPSEDVCLIVATHWHDDHIGGISELVKVCDKATFCCAAAMGREEFLSALAAIEKRPATATGSGLQELFKVFSLLADRSATCNYAISNRLILSQGDCKIWSLSPSNKAFEAFLQQVGQLVPRKREAKIRLPSLMPNEAAVVLLVSVGNSTVLLGADLERRGWLELLNDYNLPNEKPSVFKVSHHGSHVSHEKRIWTEMLDKDPIAALTPWRLAGRELPTQSDTNRILSLTSQSYITTSRADTSGVSKRRRSNAVERTIRESGARIRTVGHSSGMIRLRKKFCSQADWSVEEFGSACSLADYY